MKTKDLMGKKVYDKNAFEVGKVSELEIEASSFTIKKIFIKSGMTKQYWVSPEDIDRVGDTIILKVTKDEIKS